MASLNVASFTAFDWCLVALTAISVIAAFRRGLIKVLFSLLGLIAGIVIASWTYRSLAALLMVHIDSRLLAGIMAFLLIMIAVNLLFLLAGMVLKQTVDVVGLGFVDRTLGAAFGLVRGVLVGIVILMSLAAFLPDSTWIKNSRLAPYFLAGTHAVSFVVPESFRQQIIAGTGRLLNEPQNPPQTRSMERN